LIDSDTPFTGIHIQIPKIIWQTGKDNFEDLKYPFNLNVETWKKLNLDWEYNYTNQQEKYDQIKEFGDSELTQLSENLTGAFLADLWRYVTIYRYGGVYADLDTVARLPLDLLKYNITNILNEVFIMPDLGEWGYRIEQDPTQSAVNGKRVYCQGCDHFIKYIMKRKGHKKFYRTNSAFAAKKKAEPIKYVLDEIKIRFSMFKKLHETGFSNHHGSLSLCVDCSAWDYAINRSPSLVAQNFIYEYNSPGHTDAEGNETILFKEDFMDYEILTINTTSYNQFIKNAYKEN
jgi:hypothetical protein